MESERHDGMYFYNDKPSPGIVAKTDQSLAEAIDRLKSAKQYLLITAEGFTLGDDETHSACFMLVDGNGVERVNFLHLAQVYFLKRLSELIEEMNPIEAEYLMHLSIGGEMMSPNPEDHEDE